MNSNSTWNIFYSSKSLLANHDIFFFAEFDVTRTGTDTDAQMHAMLLCSHSQQEWCYRIHDQNPDTKKTSLANEVQNNQIRLQMK